MDTCHLTSSYRFGLWTLIQELGFWVYKPPWTGPTFCPLSHNHGTMLGLFSDLPAILHHSLCQQRDPFCLHHAIIQYSSHQICESHTGMSKRFWKFLYDGSSFCGDVFVDLMLSDHLKPVFFFFFFFSWRQCCRCFCNGLAKVNCLHIIKKVIFFVKKNSTKTCGLKFLT